MYLLSDSELDENIETTLISVCSKWRYSLGGQWLSYFSIKSGREKQRADSGLPASLKFTNRHAISVTRQFSNPKPGHLSYSHAWTTGVFIQMGDSCFNAGHAYLAHPSTTWRPWTQHSCCWVLHKKGVSLLSSLGKTDFLFGMTANH